MLSRNIDFFNWSKKDKGITLVMLFVFVPMVFKLISPFFIVLGLGQYTTIIMPSILIIGLLYSYNHFLSKISAVTIVLYLMFAVFVFLSIVVYPLSANYITNNYTRFIFGTVPYFFIGLAIDYESQKNIFKLVARSGILIQIFWQFCILVGLAEVERAEDGSLGEQMGVAYSLLFPLCVTIFNALETKSKIDFCLSIVGFVLLLFMGTRGPIIIFLFFLILYFTCFASYKTNKYLKKILSLIIGLFAMRISFIIIKLFMPIAVLLGFSTRILDSFENNEMTDLNNSSYRDEFYSSVWEKIVEDPTGLGYGLGSDRNFTPNGVYVHNFELELLCEFGLIGGGIILLMLISLCANCIRRLKGSGSLTFWFILFCCGVGSLQFSHSWLSFPMFFIFLGYSFSILRKKSYKTIN